jgi:hypothetical protein
MAPWLPRRLRAGSVLAIAALACAPIAGCGGGSSGNGLASKSPEEIVAAAKAAATHAASVHIVGSIISENKPISLDMELVAGKGAKGHLSVEGLGIEVIALEHAFYLNGSSAFYRHIAGPAAAALLQGKWLKAPTTSGEFASLAQLTELGKLVESTLSSHGELKHAPGKTVGGRQAVGVTDATRGGTLYVAATGTPFPLQITKDGSGSGTITFNRWNQPVTITAPAGAINITQLQNGR